MAFTSYSFQIIMEETIKKFREKCYVSNADVPQTFGCDKTFPEDALKMILKAKDDLKDGYFELAVLDLEYATDMYDEYYGKLANECGEVYYSFGKALYYLSIKEKFEFDSKKEENNKAEEDKKEKKLSESTDSPPAVFDEGSTDTRVEIETSEFMKEAGFSPQEVFIDGNLSKICLICRYSLAEETKKMEERRKMVGSRIFTKQWLSV